jgi:hypothetical protein
LPVGKANNKGSTSSSRCPVRRPGHGNSSSQTELFLNVRYFDYNVEVCADHLSMRFFVILSVGLSAGDRNPKYSKFGSLSAFGRQKGL